MLLISLGILGPAHALDPMRIKIRTTVPKEINTVGDAAQYYADVIGYRYLYVPTYDFFGLRGFFHSPFFAVLLSVFIVCVFYRKVTMNI